MVSRTYSDVDSSADPSAAVDWQREMTRWPAIRAYKQRNCGPGVEPASWRTLGGFTEEDLAEWTQVIPHARERGFVYLLTFLVVAGVKE